MAHSSLDFSDTSHILEQPAPFLTANGMLISEYRHTLGSLLHILLGVLVFMLWVVTYLQRDVQEQLILGCLIAMLATLEILYFRGYTQPLPSLIVSALIVCTVAGIITFGSLRSVAILGFAAALTSAGIFLSRTGLVCATAVVCAACGALTYGEMHNLLRRVHFELSLSSWLLYCVIFIGFAMSVYQSRRVTVLAIKAQARQLKRAEAAEQQAQASREQLAMVYRNSPGAITVLDGTTLAYLEVNEAFEKLIGKPRSDMLGRTSADFDYWLHPAHREAALVILAREGRVDKFESQGRSANGRVFDMEVSSIFVRGGNQDIVIAQVTDITDRKRRESLLSDMAQGFSGEFGVALLKSLAVHLAKAIGAENVIIGEISAADDVVNGTVHALAVARHGELADNYSYALKGTVCSVTVVRPDIFTLGRADPTTSPEQQHMVDLGFNAYIGVALRDAKGVPIGILNAAWVSPHEWDSEKDALVRVFASRASSELMRIRADREIQTLSTSLEQKVRDRTVQLKAANDELESFAYSVSHDLRSPLRAINGFTHVLAERLEGRLNASEQALFGHIVSGTQRMSELTTDLIGLAQINQRALVLSDVDWSALANEVVVGLRLTHPERAMTVEIAPDMRVRCDAHLGRIVLDNLIGNAWKYSCLRADAHITVGHYAGSTNELAYFFVQDNGAGFDMAYADKLFKPFHRLHNDRDFEGTGIGLATVHRIIERHNGIINGHSAPGVGAEFRFSFVDSPVKSADALFRPTSNR